MTATAQPTAQAKPAASARPASATEQPAAPKQPSGKAKDKVPPKPGNEPKDEPKGKGKDKPPAEAATPTPAAGGDVVKQLRRQRARRLGLRFLLFVALPTLLATVYYGLVASDQYESYSQFTVHSAQTSPVAGIGGLLGVIGATGAGETLVVREFILSRDMLALLDKENGFIAHFKNSDNDFLSRLDPDASFEEAYEYYEDKVQVDFDSVSGTLKLLVRASNPETAEHFALAIIKHSEAMVNRLAERERQDRTLYTEAQVKKYEERLTKARQAVLKLQHEHAELSPLQAAGAAMTIRTGLEAELAKTRAELAVARSYMTPTAPRVVALTEQAKALSAQVAGEKKRLVSPGKESGIADSLADFEEAMVEKEFAQKSYGAAMAALEIARADAARKHRYLAVIAAPSKPDDSTYPKRAYGVLTVFVMSFLLLGIASLMIAAVREHARV